MSPLAIDLYCGLGGWTEGLLAEGYQVIGFDIERRPYPGQLVIQDVLTLHGAQFCDAALIVASPPCEAYSYRAMPWKRAKALPPPDNTLFDACFRIQREACEAAGRYIPMIVENVKGAQPWVGRAKWHYGSFYLWGDVPALMPVIRLGSRVQAAAGNFTAVFTSATPSNATALQSKNGRLILTALGDRPSEAIKQTGLPGKLWYDHGIAHFGSKSDARKMASAQIAKIPLPLAQHIAQVYKPHEAVELSA